ncbi:resuscitation-promoting factor [Actinomyces urogenitalis]|uniref:resuscitation-promoting factor n=1 Tax=Actinomyces urogenitalis TaxID=103621 RepID=UPI0009DE94D8|nr:resuscitation-promoting factor [Actinomyces urogenitalis]MDU5427440.1 resuscitation-promoting factor [Actinomyces urogenitalis]MDU5874878.1 resuscitation-promoting factor [Actinomyces urogenitalis]
MAPDERTVLIVGHRTSAHSTHAHHAEHGRCGAHHHAAASDHHVLRSSLLRAGGIASVLAIAVSGGAYAAVQAAGPDIAPLSAARASLTGIGSAAQATDGQEASASIGLTVTGAQTTVSTVTEDSEQAFETVREETASLPEGETQVKTAGVNGVVRTTYQVTSQGGQEASREVLSQVTVTPATQEVILVGTASASSATTSTTADSSAGAASGDVWAALAQCESGGNPATNTGNGYYGMYQFSLSTWQALGGAGLPSEASAEAQTAMAQKLQARSGWGQWPGCNSRLGLR